MWDAANAFARNIYEGSIGDLGGQANAVTDTKENGMASFLVEHNESMRQWSVSVEKRPLY